MLTAKFVKDVTGVEEAGWAGKAHVYKMSAPFGPMNDPANYFVVSNANEECICVPTDENGVPFGPFILHSTEGNDIEACAKEFAEVCIGIQ